MPMVDLTEPRPPISARSESINRMGGMESAAAFATDIAALMQRHSCSHVALHVQRPGQDRIDIVARLRDGAIALEARAPMPPPDPDRIRRDRTDRMIGRASRDRRICPMPIAWNHFYELITRDVPHDECPPPPVSEGAWHHISDTEKRERFHAHIRFGVERGTGRASSMDRFLSDLPPDCWLTA